MSVTLRQPLLQVRDLRVEFATRAGAVRAVDRVDLDVQKGEIVGLVGESGSGKSTVGLALMGLLPRPAGRIAGGNVLLNGIDLLRLSHQDMRRVRGKEISMTFQDPMTFLNPVMRVGDQIVEGILEHQRIDRDEARRIALEWLANVLITEPKRVFSSYPFEISGGMRQRVLIAIALSCQPNLLIADEPTTALDLTIQREILDLMRSIRDRFQTAILLISHDLGVVSEICDRVYVMYGGQIMEYADVRAVLLRSEHPYTQALLRSARSIDEFHRSLYSLEGSVPSLIDPPAGCRFRARCPHVFERCLEEPPLLPTAAGGMTKCWLSE